MKKLLSVCLALIMVTCFSVTAFAEGGFVGSPSGNLAPTVVESNGDISVHAYADRHSLTDEQRAEMEDAYNSIRNAENLTDLNSRLKDIAKGKKIAPENLGASDLFYVSYNGKGEFKKQNITLEADTLNNFVALMAFVNGEWIIVDGAKVEGGKLSFLANQTGPYAIVVDKEGAKSPQTGVNGVQDSNDYSFVLYGALMLVSAFAAVALWRKAKKQTV